MASTTPPPVSNERKNDSKRLLIITLCVVLLVACVLWKWLPGKMVKTEDAYVDGNAVQITSQVSGTVLDIEADDTDAVGAGATLVRLNNVDAEIHCERASAALARATRNARIEYAQVGQLNAELQQQMIGLARAKSDYTRRAELVDSGAVTREEASHARDALETAQAAVTVTTRLLEQKQAMVDKTTLWTHPDVLTAASNLRDAYVARERTNVVSPVAGTVTRRSVQVGQRISPGMSLMSVVPLNALWVNANFKESQLGNLRMGQRVRLTSDMYGDNVLYHGTVVGLDAGTGSALSLLPAQNATGNWIKVTQRVPVRISLDPSEVKTHPLRIGLSMHASIDTSQSDLPRIGMAQSRNTQYSTTVFDHELRDANAVVRKIIADNATIAIPADLSIATR